ncbi:nucleotide exchange factor GrpE [Lewinella sp. W8]|uniref:nucleotide exchange factor GrpE n=1 Tax=Lewinella sp. W8 TaxID=2528208 RepID=UPI00106843AF|nr:nucleotide exchange factor GrpE [Lewinella sp. W8]MTB51868.1 nucleotide exchange factor GrpE [Lewinella sp. W8]
MAKKNSNEPIVDDELLEQSGAEPEENTVADPVEEELIEQQEQGEPENESAFTQKIADLEDRNLRLRAEFENFKRRSNREKLDLIETAGKKTMLALLPVLDDFDRAKQQALSDEGTAKVWESGIGLIVKKLLTSLEAQGLRPMDSTGKDFDADFHEAVTEIPNPEMSGKVVDTIERGYTLNGKIIRHAKVVVGK